MLLDPTEINFTCFFKRLLVIIIPIGILLRLLNPSRQHGPRTLCTGSSIPSWTLWTMTLAPEVATAHGGGNLRNLAARPPSAGSKTRLPLPSTWPVSRCVGVIQCPTTACTVPHLLLSHFWHQEVAGGDSEFPRWREGRCLQTEKELAASYVLRSCLCLGASIARTVLDTTYLG